jgi:hypothetical protein
MEDRRMCNNENELFESLRLSIKKIRFVIGVEHGVCVDIFQMEKAHFVHPDGGVEKNPFKYMLNILRHNAILGTRQTILII